MGLWPGCWRTWICPAPTAAALSVTGAEPLADSPHPLATGIAAVGLAAVALGLPAQSLRLELVDAFCHLHSEHTFAPRLNGRPYASRMVRDNPALAQPYLCWDGIWAMPSVPYKVTS